MCTPSSPCRQQAPGKEAELRAPQDKQKRGREWDHCQNYTIKSSTQQKCKTGLSSGGWPGWPATICLAFLSDMVLCYFLYSDTGGRTKVCEGSAYNYLAVTISRSRYNNSKEENNDCHQHFIRRDTRWGLECVLRKGYTCTCPESLLLDYGSITKDRSATGNTPRVCRHCSFPTIHMDCCN